MKTIHESLAIGFHDHKDKYFKLEQTELDKEMKAKDAAEGKNC